MSLFMRSHMKWNSKFPAKLLNLKLDLLNDDDLMNELTDLGVTFFS